MIGSGRDIDYAHDGFSHWAEEGRWEDAEAWENVGKAHLEMFRKLCQLAEIARPVKTMIEWGPGGGANAVWFCTEVDDFYGVDISEANLTECQRQLQKRNLNGFHPILVDHLLIQLFLHKKNFP